MFTVINLTKQLFKLYIYKYYNYKSIIINIIIY